MRPARFASLLSCFVLLLFASMARGGAAAQSAHAELAPRAEKSNQREASAPGSRSYQRQDGDAPTPAGELEAVEPQDSEDPTALAAPRAHAAATLELDQATCSLASTARGAPDGTYSPQNLAASILATGPPSTLQ